MRRAALWSLAFLAWTTGAEAQTLRLQAMNYNVKHTQAGPSQIAKIIADAGATVVGLEETSPANAGAIAQSLQTRTGRPWYFTAMQKATARDDFDAVVSSYPIVSSTHIAMYWFNDYYSSIDDMPRAVLLATLAVPDAGGQPHRLQFFVTHLSTRQRLSASYPSPRARQIDELVDFVQAFPKPWILVGDFNTDKEQYASEDTPLYNKIIAGGFTDSFREINPTVGGDTLDVPNPTKRYDYVFYSKAAGLNAVSSRVVINADTNAASDHYPVLSALDWDGGTWADPAAGQPAGSGSVSRELWNGIAGPAVSDLTGSPAYQSGSPSATETLSAYLQPPFDSGDSYGQRIRGYLTAPETGSYKLWIASDNQSQLWLSTDEDPAHGSKIAWIEGSNWTYSAEWDKYENAVSADVQQESNPVSLVAGRRYYFEVLHKEATGHDAVAVGWQLPSGLYERPIQARHLSPAGTPAPPAPLPAPWDHRDIGAVGVAGSASPSSGTFTVKGGGTDLWDTADAFHFVHQPLTGDGEIVADVSSLVNPSGAAWSLAAVTMREKLTADSIHASMMITTDGKAKFRRRAVEGGTTASDGPSTGTTYPPRWLKLTRAGDTFTAAISGDGVTWTPVHTPQTIPMAQTVQVGFLALRNGGAAPAATATFQQVSVTKLPAPWQEADIGTVGASGGAALANGTFTLQAGGTDLWDTADAFHYVYQPMSGDGEIVADLQDLTVPTGSSWSLAAVMVRQDLTAGSVHASMMITTDGKAKFRRRTAAGGTTASDGPSAGTTYPPRWLKLTRAGNVFTASISNDGASWTQVHTPQTIPMPADVVVGLAVLRNGGTGTATATIGDVTVVP